MPAITVLMTVYNGMPYLPIAINSLLEQTWDDFELLIVNDCSTDGSREVIRGYEDRRIRLIDNEVNIKQTRSLNRGLEVARSEFVARLDADDVSHPQRLEKQLAYLREHPDTAAVGAGLRFIDPAGRVTGKLVRPTYDMPLRWLQLFDCPISCGAVMFRKSVIWNQLGGFDPTISLPQDWELWSRVPRNHELANLPDLLVDIRRHPECQTISSSSRLYEEQKRIVRANVQRLLQMTDSTDEWFRKVDTLVARRVDRPEDRIEVIQICFERFCALYPSAPRDTEVLRELARQYLRVIYRTVPWKRLKALALIMTAAPVASRRLSLSRLACSVCIREIGVGHREPDSFASDQRS